MGIGLQRKISIGVSEIELGKKNGTRTLRDITVFCHVYCIAQIFEGKIRMPIIHRYNDYIP